MNTYEILGRLKDHRMDLEIGGDLRTAEAVNAAIAMLEDRARYDWLSASEAREQLARMQTQLKALAPLMSNMVGVLDRVIGSVPRGYQRDAATEARDAIDRAFDSIFHPSFYGKAGNL